MTEKEGVLEKQSFLAGKLMRVQLSLLPPVAVFGSSSGRALSMESLVNIRPKKLLSFIWLKLPAGSVSKATSENKVTRLQGVPGYPALGLEKF